MSDKYAVIAISEDTENTIFDRFCRYTYQTENKTFKSCEKVFGNAGNFTFDEAQYVAKNLNSAKHIHNEKYIVVNLQKLQRKTC